MLGRINPNLLAILAALALLASPARAASSTGTLVVCDDVQDPPALNPFLTFSEKTYTLLQQMLEGLVRFDPRGRIEPALAQSWERIDDATMRFHLRPGVRFHNGEPFDARAVKFSLEKYVAPETHFLGYGFVETISSVAVVDDYTADVITRRPDGLLLHRLAAWVHIVPPRYYAGVGEAGFSAHPIGTGPFQFEGREKGKNITMRANPKYWMGGIPKLEALVFKYIPVERQVDSLLAGEIDILTDLPGTRTLDAQKNAGTYVIKQPSFNTVVGNFNLGRLPFSDQRVRRALNLGLDRKTLVRYDVFGNGLPLGTITLPGESGHKDAIKPYPYDPKEARRLLAQAGYGNGLTLKLLLKVNAERAGRIIANQWRQIGVRLKVTLFTDAQIPDYFKDSRQMDWDLMITDCPDPMNNAFFIRSIYLDPASPFSFHGDPVVGRRLAELVGILDPERQRLASEELDQHIHDEFKVLPTYQRIRTYGLRHGVHFEPYVSGMPHFYGAFFDGAKSPRAAASDQPHR